MLGVAAIIHWARYRGRGRAWLATALGLLGAVVLLPHAPPSWLRVLPYSQQLEVAGFMGSGFALVEFRRSLAPMRTWRYRVLALMVAVATITILLLPLLGHPGRSAAVSGGAAGLLVVLWAACVIEPAVTFWRISSKRPPVQRARLRALSLGYATFAGVVLVAVGSSIVRMSTGGRPNPWLDTAVSLVALAMVPVLYSSFSPPAWLRHSWRAGEEHIYLCATDSLIARSDDELTMATRALEWAVRLLGAEGGMLVSPHGSVVTQGLAVTEANSRDQLVVRLRGKSGEGKLVLVAGPITPLFGSDEVNRLSAYAIAVTAALERARDSERLSTLLVAVGELGEGIVITEAGRLVYANEAYARLTGY
ncbi:MAG: hypothetical protein ACYDGR_06460, partial [Candidatus Dormibacteria bacterium]